jgi:tetratricopeptide (TPR) repeat protein
VEYLEARLLVNQGKWLEASRVLERSHSLMTRWPALSKQADLFLGLCYEQLGDADRQYAAYRRAVKADPFWIPAGPPASKFFTRTFANIAYFDFCSY